MVALNVRQAELVPEATWAAVALEGQPPIAGRLTNVRVVLYIVSSPFRTRKPRLADTWILA